MAGGIADGEEDGPGCLASVTKRLTPPWVPVDRVVCVLEQVWARLVGQTIGLVRVAGRRHACRWYALPGRAAGGLPSPTCARRPRRELRTRLHPARDREAGRPTRHAGRAARRLGRPIPVRAGDADRRRHRGPTLPDTDLVFLAADSLDELAPLVDLRRSIKPAGAIWVVSRKGKAATLRTST